MRSVVEVTLDSYGIRGECFAKLRRFRISERGPRLRKLVESDAPRGSDTPSPSDDPAQARTTFLDLPTGVALLGDAGWCHVMLEGGADVEAANRAGRRALHIFSGECALD